MLSVPPVEFGVGERERQAQTAKLDWAVQGSASRVARGRPVGVRESGNIRERERERERERATERSPL